MTEPLVTVLVPVYNAEKYLKQALLSIINQTYNNLEILIINDGSCDNSEAIIKYFQKQDHRIKYVYQENQGVARTLRSGVELAQGELIRRHDADDMSLPYALEEQVKFLLEHPEYGAVATQQCHLTENGKIAWNKRLPREQWFEGKEYKELTLDDFSPERSAPIVHGTVMFYKSLALEVGNYREQFLVAEDYDLWLRLMDRKKIAILHSCTYFLRIHGSSAMSRYRDFARFYNSMAIEMARQRQERSADDIQLGNPLPTPQPKKLEENGQEAHPRGRRLRDDLSFMYSLAWDARDLRLIKKIGGEILRDGWRLPQTYKMLIFPLLGQRLINLGVKTKALLRKIFKNRLK